MVFSIKKVTTFQVVVSVGIIGANRIDVGFKFNIGILEVIVFCRNSSFVIVEFSGKINRKDWGLNWNSALETGGVLVGEDVKLNIELQLVKL